MEKFNYNCIEVIKILYIARMYIVKSIPFIRKFSRNTYDTIILNWDWIMANGEEFPAKSIILFHFSFLFHKNVCILL